MIGKKIKTETKEDRINTKNKIDELIAKNERLPLLI